MPVSETPAPERILVRRLRIAIVVLAVLAAGLLVWNALRGEDDEPTADSGEAQIVSVAELSNLAGSAQGPIYWAGERPGAELEYSEAGDRAYVRYLTGDAEAGDPRPAFLAVSTYPLPDAVAALLANARRTGTELQRTEGGALVWVNPDRPTSVYLAEPGSAYQVEVYDPSPRRALALALSGDIVPVG
jgi:hypothetical protein